jgi:hypothetical protein
MFHSKKLSADKADISAYIGETGVMVLLWSRYIRFWQLKVSIHETQEKNWLLSSVLISFALTLFRSINIPYYVSCINTFYQVAYVEVDI